MKNVMKWYSQLPEANYLAYVRYMYEKTRLYCYAQELYRLGVREGFL
jgi:hypothetical protein